MSGEKQRDRDEQTREGMSWMRSLGQLVVNMGVVLGGVAIAGLVLLFLFLIPGALTWLFE